MAHKIRVKVAVGSRMQAALVNLGNESWPTEFKFASVHAYRMPCGMPFHSLNTGWSLLVIRPRSCEVLSKAVYLATASYKVLL